MMPRVRWLELLAIVPIGVFVLLFAFLPVAGLFAQALYTGGGLTGFFAVITDPLNLRAFSNSLEQGGLSAGLAVMIGYPVGLLFGRYEWKGRSAMHALLLVPFLLPTVVVVLGVLSLFGPNGALTTYIPALDPLGRGLGGILVVNVYFNVSIVALLVSVAVARGSPALEETVGTLGGSPWHAYRDVWGPPSWIGAAAGGLLTFLFSALAFAAPIMICGASCYTLEARVWELSQGPLLDPTGASLLALAMVLLLAAPTVGYLVLLRRLRPTVDEPLHPPRAITWRSPTTLALVGITGAVLTAVAGLLVAVILTSLRAPPGGQVGSGWSELFGSSVSQELGVSIGVVVGNTILFATLAAALAVLLGVFVGFSLTRRPSWSSGLAFYLFIPLLLSPVLLALALATFWRPVLGGEAMVWILIVVSQAVLALPFALQNLDLSLRTVSRSPRESAETLGATPWTAYTDVELPQVRSGLRTAALFAFALCLGEFTATYFLVTPPFTTLSVSVYLLQQVRMFAPSSAAAALLALVSFAVLFVLAVGGRRVEL